MVPGVWGAIAFAVTKGARRVVVPAMDYRALISYGFVSVLLSCASAPTDVRHGVQYGKASFYGHGDGFHGRRTASGEIFDRNSLTAAHRTHPFGTLCRVTNLSNGKSVVVRINNRGPFKKGRIIDVSYAAAKEIGLVRAGVVDAKVGVVKIGK